VDEIIVGVDDSDTARRAARTAARIAAESHNTLHIVMCVPRRAHDMAAASDRWHLDAFSSAEQYLDSLIPQLPTATVTRTVSFDDPATALCDEASRLHARMIVVGNRRVNGAARVLGSVAIEATRRATVDVLIANTTLCKEQ